MSVYSFSQFSPSGNITLFLHTHPMRCGKELCSLAMEHIKAEQAAFADMEKKALYMAGGEFCVNACRAFGALLDMEAENSDRAREYMITASGSEAPVRLVVRGHIPAWRVSASFSFQNPYIWDSGGKITLVKLPGISHLLIREDFPPAGDAATLAQCLIKDHNLENAQAAGVVWWRETPSGREILPYVIVPRAGTAMLETSCGSGSLALAYALRALGLGCDFSIGQPGGAVLHISLDEKSCFIDGDVRLLSCGHIWLNMDNAADEDG